MQDPNKQGDEIRDPKEGETSKEEKEFQMFPDGDFDTEPYYPL